MCSFRRTRHKSTKTIEGFGGKRVLDILFKGELCQKHSKFRLQFCLCVLRRNSSEVRVTSGQKPSAKIIYIDLIYSI